MRIVNSLNRMQAQARRWQRTGIKVGFVPTMGCLHAGHISLVERARKAVGRNGKVVVSIYVNPTQFGPKEDFSRYPRNLAGDAKLCRDAGVDVIFAPADAEMYPRDGKADFSTYVVEEGLARFMEGVTRPGHFRGVCTVVAKLFNLVLPDVAVFGAKDWQQAAVIRRMVRDLNFPLEIIVAPTRREADGLAMSSRNKYLTPEERAQAVILSCALNHARSLVKRGAVPAGRLGKALAQFIGAALLGRLDYVAFFDPETLVPLKRVGPGAQMALAVYFGKTRLIDNGRL